MKVPSLTADDNMNVHNDDHYQVKHSLYIYALDIQLVMPSHYKKTANQSVHTIVAIR